MSTQPTFFFIVFMLQACSDIKNPLSTVKRRKNLNVNIEPRITTDLTLFGLVEMSDK